MLQVSNYRHDSENKPLYPLLPLSSLSDVLQVEVVLHQQASLPIGGSYTFSFGSNITHPLEYDASPSEVSIDIVRETALFQGWVDLDSLPQLEDRVIYLNSHYRSRQLWKILKV